MRTKRTSASVEVTKKVSCSNSHARTRTLILARSYNRTLILARYRLHGSLQVDPFAHRFVKDCAPFYRRRRERRAALGRPRQREEELSARTAATVAVSSASSRAAIAVSQPGRSHQPSRLACCSAGSGHHSTYLMKGAISGHQAGRWRATWPNGPGTTRRTRAGSPRRQHEPRPSRRYTRAA